MCIHGWQINNYYNEFEIDNNAQYRYSYVYAVIYTVVCYEKCMCYACMECRNVYAMHTICMNEQHSTNRNKLNPPNFQIQLLESRA